MPQTASAKKISGNDEHFYFQAGGYVLLRITKTPGEFGYSVMTVTTASSTAAACKAPHLYAPEIVVGGEAASLMNIDSVEHCNPTHERAYPDADKLISAVSSLITVEENDLRRDPAGRRFIILSGITSPATVRAFGNDIADVLCLEKSVEPWVYSEPQTTSEDLPDPANTPKPYRCLDISCL